MSSDPSERVHQVNGIDLHVTDTGGSGRPLLTLHGITMDATAEQREISALAPAHRVVAPDLRGHGRSTRPAKYTMADHVHDLVALLDALRIEQIDLLGASMGSYIAQALAIAVPHRIGKLVLVVSASHGETSSSSRVLAEHADEVGHLSPEQQQQWLAARLFAPQTPPPVRQEVFDWFASRRNVGLALSAAEVEAANDAVLGFDFRPQLPSLDVPALVISGRYDILNPPAAGEEIARLVPSARFEIFEQSGHLATFEEPRHYADSVTTFLTT